MLQYIIGSLQKLAATRDLAVVVLTQCATRMQAERGATLIPAINATVWEQGISTRLVLFRDWLRGDSETRGLHFAAIQKLHGKEMAAPTETACPFRVDEVSAEPRHGVSTAKSCVARPGPCRARQHSAVDGPRIYPGSEAQAAGHRLRDC